MLLTRFKAKDIHGYLPFDVTFNRDLTFLTGINGSGKTTAINSMIALVTPDLHYLSNLTFGEMSIELEHDSHSIIISATGGDDYFTLRASGVKEELKIQRFVIDADVPTPRAAEHEAEHFRDLTLSCATHPVMRLLERLPTPMFLGLDRRARFGADERRRFMPLWKVPRSGKGIASTSLSRSLLDAADLAATSNRNALISAGRIAEDLQRDLLLSLLTVSPEDYGNVTAPTADEVRELSRVRRDLSTFPEIFRLPRDEVQGRVAPFLDEMQRSLNLIPSGTDLQALGSTAVDPQLLQALFKWSANRPQLKRIRVISEVVENYNDRRARLLEPIARYQKLVNKFLTDSGKTIAFDDDGFVHVNIDGLSENREITSLSSGEAQIFVILSHLAFNTNASRANVFIVDEPEISLHVLWQEIFVESVQAANPEIQYIMATHSPSIIMDQTKRCIDLSRVKDRNRRQ